MLREVLYILSLVALATPSFSLISPTAGASACADLSKSLGPTKVVFGVDPAYVYSTTYYYSLQQASNKPACAVEPTMYTDVQTAVQTIRKYNSTMAVKAGGHQTNNLWSSTANGVLIDLKNMNAKNYTAATKIGYYQGGNVYGDLYHYFAQYKVVPVGARISPIGTGLALGGGLSFLSAEYGLACDSFQALDVVLADGTLVYATKDNQYSDLLFAIKGGGNQFGVVVGYYVEMHPQDYDAYGGLLVYGPDQIGAVYSQLLKFTNENADPKAAVIGTLNVVGTPSIGGDLLKPLGLDVQLDTFLLLFNVYDGPNPPSSTFAAFSSIPHLADTRKTQPYTAVEDMVEIGHLSSGAVSYRAGSHPSLGSTANNTLFAAIENFRSAAQTMKGQYDLMSFDMQPVPASLVQASRARGGNAQQAPDGPFYWINYLCSVPGVDPSKCDASLKRYVDLTPNEKGLPIFLNDANADQPILQSYGAYEKLKETKSKYDPDNFLQTNMGGPRFS